MSLIIQHKRLFLSVPLLALLVVAVGLFVGNSVFANGTPFEGDDGNFVPDGSTDWQNFETAPGAPFDVAVGDETPIDIKADNSFKGGTSEDTAVPVIGTGSIPPNKNNLLRFYVQDEEIGGKTFLYLGWVRKDTPLGTANMDFELNQSDVLSANGVTPVRTAGDILIQYDFASGGEFDELELYLAKWITSGTCEKANAPPCWGVRSADLIGAGHAEAGVNHTAVDDKVFGGTVGDRSFGEAAINLTDAGVLAPCVQFGKAYVKSRSSDSFTASLKDFIAPIDVTVGESCSIGSRKFHDFNADGTDVVDSGANLGGEVDATTTTIPVSTTTGLAVDDVIKIVDEKMLITDILDATHIGVERGINGTTPATHASELDIFMVEDPGLGDWEIHLVGTDTNGPIHQHLTTCSQAGIDGAIEGGLCFGKELGFYQFDNLLLGSYTVCEELQGDWIQSLPSGNTLCDSVSPSHTGLASAGYPVVLDSDNPVSHGRDFGNYRKIEISGRKFEDLDADGSVNGDPGLDGWTINVYADDGDGSLDSTEVLVAPVATMTTAAGTFKGEYSFLLDPGDYVVCEMLLTADWIQSYPTGNTSCANVAGAANVGWPISLQSGDPADTGNDFGNWTTGTREGQKFQDLDGDGDPKEGSDPFLNDWVIMAYVDDGNGSLSQAEYDLGPEDSDTTAGAEQDAGSYLLTLDPGDYIVCEEMKDGWMQASPLSTTTPQATADCSQVNTGANPPLGPGGYAITVVSSGSEVGNDFGNKELFVAIVIVCNQVTRELVQSSVLLQGVGSENSILVVPAHTPTGGSTSLSAAGVSEIQLCDIRGAQFEDLVSGQQAPITITIP